MTYTRVTTASDPNRWSFYPNLSADGTRVAFVSDSDFFGQGISYMQEEIWLYDTATMTLTRVTTATDPSRSSSSPSLSADGTRVVFESDSDFLGQGIPHEQFEIWLYDTVSGGLTRVTNASDPDRDSRVPSLSADGTVVAFSSDSDLLGQGIPANRPEIWLYDTVMMTYTRVTTAMGSGERTSWNPSLSADGTVVAFRSDSDFLGQGISENQHEIWLYDLPTMTYRRVTSASDGDRDSTGPSLSADGTVVAFFSDSDFLNQGIPDEQDEIWLYRPFEHSLHLPLVLRGWPPPVPDRGTTTLVSVNTDGEKGNDDSKYPSISEDGRYVAFHSSATNLVQGDTNVFCDTDYDEQYDDNCEDIFVHDRQTGVTTRVSVASDGTEGNAWSVQPSISGNGRFVAFRSGASNLVEDDTNHSSDSFVHDRVTGETTRVSVASDGAQASSGSLVFSISTSGRYVAFTSFADDLVAGDDNYAYDVFVRDRDAGETTRVSVDSDGAEGDDHSWGGGISADGRYVAFYSDATDLVEGDTNNFCDSDNDGVYEDNCTDVFVHDRQTGDTTRVSVSSDGTQGNGSSWWISISGDGRYVAFTSYASNLVTGDTNNFCDYDNDSIYDDNCTDIFVHDRETGETTLVSVASDGAQANYSSSAPSISGDGRYVTFGSFASNLVESDTNGVRDIFIHDRQTGQTERVSVGSDGSQANYLSRDACISGDGHHVSFSSQATTLVEGETGIDHDIFVHHR
jgi:Tol biopolymer transport system component